MAMGTKRENTPGTNLITRKQQDPLSKSLWLQFLLRITKSVVMSASDQKPPDGVVEVATSGIRDVSLLLPLLGTGQCERLVTSALERGLLYAAATPMSIFGSLGIAKAGFVVLWASIDSQWFPGPSLLRNAGFTPPGIGTLLVHVGDDNRHLYTAEDKLRRILAKKHIHSVDVNFQSEDLFLWNIRLVSATIFLSTFTLLPYVFPIVRFLPNQPFHVRWFYPTLRIVGCDIVAITIQLIFQLRILEETYCRIRFMATDAFLKDHGKPVPPFWDPNENSKNILRELRRLCHSSGEGAAGGQRGAHNLPKSDPSPPRLPRPQERHDPSSLDADTKESIREGLGRMSSFNFPLYPTPGDEQQSDPISSTSAEKGVAEVPLPFSAVPSTTHIITTRLLLFAFQITLLFGLILAVVGYIGCFSVVQASPREDSRGVLIWLICEAFLAVLRTLVWAANPKWDDAKSPIALEKVATTTENKTEDENTSSYGIGWMLSSVTADDMHALIVGINKFGDSSNFHDLNECVPDAKRISSYLKDTLLVPRDQIVTLYDSEATKERIIQELQALSHRTSVASDAPIIIYLASHTGTRLIEGKEQMYLVPHCGAPEAGKDAYISYDSIVDMIGHIADRKTDNTILILDTCHAGAMGINEKFAHRAHPKRPRHSHQSTQSRGTELEGSVAKKPDSGLANLGSGVDPSAEGHSNALKGRGLILRPRPITEVLIGHPSHILIAGTSSKTLANENKGHGGVFTTSLLETLQKSEFGALGRMSYKELVKEINSKLAAQKTPQRASCTSIYQNRLLFNGLFSRRVSPQGLRPVITVKYSDLKFTHDV